MKGYRVPAEQENNGLLLVMVRRARRRGPYTVILAEQVNLRTREIKDGVLMRVSDISLQSLSPADCVRAGVQAARKTNGCVPNVVTILYESTKNIAAAIYDRNFEDALSFMNGVNGEEWLDSHFLPPEEIGRDAMDWLHV